EDHTSHVMSLEIARPVLNFFFFFFQAEDGIRYSKRDWSSDVCSSDLTLKDLNTALGKETIDSFNQSENRGSQVSHGLNYQKLGKALMDIDELAVLDGSKCILQLRGVRPFLSDKYDITRHPNYRYLSDADARNTFNLDNFLKSRWKVPKDQLCDVVEIRNVE